jgi:hypothetical protein
MGSLKYLHTENGGLDTLFTDEERKKEYVIKMFDTSFDTLTLVHTTYGWPVIFLQISRGFHDDRFYNQC